MEAFTWVGVVGTLVLLFGFIVRHILKPWSDAALEHAKAFHTHVKMLDEQVPKIVTALNTGATLHEKIELNTDSVNKNTAMLNDFAAKFDWKLFEQIRASARTPEELRDMLLKALKDSCPAFAATLTARELDTLVKQHMKNGDSNAAND